MTLNLLDPKKYSTLFYLYLLFLKYMYILKSITNNAGCRIMKWSSKTLLKLSGFSRDQWYVSKRAAPSPNLLANIHTPTNRRLNMVFRNQSYSFKRKMKPRNSTGTFLLGVGVGSWYFWVRPTNLMELHNV